MALKFAKLHGRAIAALSSGEKITEHGIIVEKLASGDVRFSINVMVDGQRIHRVVGKESEGVRRGNAERLIEKLRTEAREGRLNLPEGRKLHRTFAEAATEYVRRMEATDGKDMKNKKRHLTQRLVPFLGRVRLDKITHHKLKEYRKARAGQGAAAATINRELSTLSHLLNHASSKDWGWMSKADLPELPRDKETRKRIRILTPQQRVRLLEAAAADQNPRVWLFVLFGLNASMRHSEIVQRRYDEVDFNSCNIWINKAKAGERQQPITPALRDALLYQRAMEDDPDGWIFPAMRSGTKTGHCRDMRGPFKRAVVRAGLDPAHCTPHVMRHTAISALAMAKTDIPTIQKISGHKTAAMVLHYVHLFGDHVHDAINTLNIAVPEPITPELHTGERG